MNSKLLIIEDLGMFHADYSPCLYFSHLLLILCKKNCWIESFAFLLSIHLSSAAIYRSFRFDASYMMFHCIGYNVKINNFNASVAGFQICGGSGK